VLTRENASFVALREATNASKTVRVVADDEENEISVLFEREILVAARSVAVECPSTACGFDGNHTTGLFDVAWFGELRLTNVVLRRGARLVGAAIWVSHGASLRLESCAFLENVAEWGGGAILAEYDSVVDARRTTMAYNGAYFGAALAVGPRSTMRLTDNCTIANNSGIQNVVELYEESELDASDLEFVGNFATRTPIYASGGSVARCHWCTFAENSAELTAPTLHIDRGAHFEGSETLFARNGLASDGSGAFGGALRLDNGATAAVSDCTFQDLNAEDGGAVVVDDGSFLDVRRCLFEDNAAFADDADNG